MRLLNKKTGEIGRLSAVVSHDEDTDSSKVDLAVVFENDIHRRVVSYNSLAELCEEWTDAPKKPKEYWYITDIGRVLQDKDYGTIGDTRRTKIGNHFSSQEEAEKALKKLEAFKRLKDKGFKFCGWEDLEAIDPETSLLISLDVVEGESVIGFRMDDYRDCLEDLNILFGGEDE